MTKKNKTTRDSKISRKHSHTYLCSCVVYADADADVFSFVFDEMSCALHRQQRVLRARGSERLRGFSLLVFFGSFGFSMIFFLKRIVYCNKNLRVSRTLMLLKITFLASNLITKQHTHKNNNNTQQKY